MLMVCGHRTRLGCRRTSLCVECTSCGTTGESLHTYAFVPCLQNDGDISQPHTGVRRITMDIVITQDVCWCSGTMVMMATAEYKSVVSVGLYSWVVNLFVF